MQMNSIDSLFFVKNIQNKSKNNRRSNLSKNCHSVNVSFDSIPAEAIKANFCPSFGKYRKVDDITLLDKNTGFNVKASLSKEKIGDFVSYKIFVDKKEVGFMDMNCSSLFPEGDYVLTEPNNVIPEITHLRSLAGEKYSGIGTALVNAAVKESKKRGNDGCLFLTAEKGYGRTFSNYRSGESPIPFYYKLGFKAVDPKVDRLIEECIEKSNYNMLPDSALLLLTPEAISRKNKYFSKNYTFC